MKIKDIESISVPLFSPELFEKTETIYLPEHIYPLSREENIHHILIEALAKFGPVYGSEAELIRFGKSSCKIDVVCDARDTLDSIIGIEVKREPGGFNKGDDIKKMVNFVNSGTLDAIFACSFSGTKGVIPTDKKKINLNFEEFGGMDEREQQIMRSHLSKIGIIRYTPLGKIEIVKDPVRLERKREPICIGTQKSEKEVVHAVWKYFREKGYIVAAESELPGAATSYVYHGKTPFGAPIGSYKKYLREQKKIPRPDLTAMPQIYVNNPFPPFQGEYIGVEAKGIQCDLSKLGDQLRKYLDSGNLSKLYVAVPESEEKRMNDYIKDKFPNDVGMIIVHEDGGIEERKPDVDKYIRTSFTLHKYKTRARLWNGERNEVYVYEITKEGDTLYVK